MDEPRRLYWWARFWAIIALASAAASVALALWAKLGG
jgi:hypothetical protein